MADSILRKILERIDETEEKFVLRDDDVKGHSPEELKLLLECGILVQKVYSSIYAKGAVYFDDGTREEREYKTPPRPFYTIVVPRILEIICEDNALKGSPQDLIEGRLFELGEKRFQDLPPIRTYLSLRNRDMEWFDTILGRIRRQPDNPALLLVPRQVLISNEDDKSNRSCGLAVCCIAECLTSESWVLPWEKLRKDFRTAIVSGERRSIPGEPFPAPDGIRWSDVRITMTDFELRIEARGKVKNYTYKEAGFEDKRRKDIQDSSWKLLKIFATRGGMLPSSDDLLDTRTRKNFKSNVSVLRARIRAVIPNVEDDPIPLDSDKKCYRTAFKISTKDFLQFPTPEGTAWSNVSITETSSSCIRITVVSKEIFAAPIYSGNSETPEWEAAQREEPLERKYDFRTLGLQDENGKINPEGEVLVTVLRNGGMVESNPDDKRMLNLGNFLSSMMDIDDPPFDFSYEGNKWTAKFEASSELKPPR